MRIRFVWMGCLLVGLQGLWGAQGYLLVQEGNSSAKIESAKRQLEGLLAVDGSYRRIIGESPTMRVEKAGDRFVLELGPLHDMQKAKLLAARVKKIFPGTQLVEVQRRTLAEANSKTASVSRDDEKKGSMENLELWIALFALALTGVLALFVSSRRIERLRREQDEIRDEHREMEQQFNDLFDRMGRNIYSLGKEIVETTSEVAERIEHEEIGGKLKRVISSETRILDTTSTLLEFLRIKSGKVETQIEPFDLNRLLDEVLGNLSSRIRSEREPELILHLGKELPREVVGDFGNMADLLVHLLENALVHTAEREIRLHADISKIAGRGYGLDFLLDYETSPDLQEPREGYFKPVYDEERGEYRRLECFIARELTRLLGGTIEVGFRDEAVRVGVKIPLEMGQERRRYRLRSKELTEKAVLIINQSKEASEGIAELFSYFRHQTKIMEAEEFESRKPPLAHYDILVIEESLVGPLLIEFLQKVRRHKEIKVISVRNLFAPADAHFDESVVEARLTKPLTLERVYRLIEDLYPPRSEEEERQERERLKSGRNFDEKIEEKAGVSIGDFADFAGATLLIVEDNPINLQMLLKVLERSQMRLLTALNGEEAVAMVEKEEKIDLVLMDINMPVMDGYTATRLIRKLPRGAKLPILALTALKIENEIDRMRDSGLDGYLPKPLNIGQLYRAFERYLPSNDQAPRLPEPEICYPEVIDIDRALSHPGMNEWMLQELLREFVDLYGNSDHVIAALYDRGDRERMGRELSELLGLSSALGALALYEEIKSLYRTLLLRHDEEIPAAIKGYSRELKKLKESIWRYLDSIQVRQ